MKYRNAAVGAAFATAALLLFGTAATAQVTITEAPSAPPPADPGTGLLGNYYGQAGQEGDAAAAAYTASNSPIATFLATEVDYPGPPGVSADDGDTLDDFLGADALTLSDPSVGSNNLNGQLMMFTGFLDVTAPGTYTFTVAVDDGAFLDFGSQEVIDNPGFHPLSGLSAQLLFTQAGLYSMALTYYEDGGQTGINFLDGSGNPVPTNLLYQSIPVSPEPGSAPLLLATLSMVAPIGMLRLRRRRSAA